MAGLAGVIACILGLWVAATAFVPAYSARTYIKSVDATVDLKFYWVWDETREDGRYLTISTLHGALTYPICGFDWAHWHRTNIYLAGERKIAVVGPRHCDYLISVDALAISPASHVASADWIYLGAFDFVPDPSGPSSRALQFMSAIELPECIEDAREPPMYPWAVRNTARKSSCP